MFSTSTIKMINSGDYNHNYALSFFGKDLKEIKDKIDQKGENYIHGG